MKLKEALTEIRRKMGIINFNNQEDLYWSCDKIVRENKKVFDELAKN